MSLAAAARRRVADNEHTSNMQQKSRISTTYNSQSLATHINTQDWTCSEYIAYYMRKMSRYQLLFHYTFVLQTKTCISVK